MNTESQLELHPDAESLTAFAEQLLPDRERQPILAHLATCARCRQILFLAQDAADAAEQPAPAGPFLLPSAGKKPLAGPRFAWGALAACAALVAVTFFVYPMHRAAAPEQSKTLPLSRPSAPAPLVQPPAPNGPTTRQPQAVPLQPEPNLESNLEPNLDPNLDLASGAVATPSAAAQPVLAQPVLAQPVLAQPAQAKPPAQSADAAPPVTALNAPPAPAPPAPAQTASAAPQSATQPAIQPTNQTVNVVVDNAAIQPTASQLTETIAAEQVLPADEVQLKARSIKQLGAMQTAPDRVQTQVQTRAQTRAQTQVQSRAQSDASIPSSGPGSISSAPQPAKSPKSFAKLAPRPLTVTPEDESAARETLHRTLPSGLPAVATASASHRLLAVDSAGAVFLSEDAGQVWEPVPQPWPGRAAGVQLAGAAIQTAAAQTAGRPAQPICFEIVTEDGVRWTSTDGRIWTPK